MGNNFARKCIIIELRAGCFVSGCLLSNDLKNVAFHFVPVGTHLLTTVKRRTVITDLHRLSISMVNIE